MHRGHAIAVTSNNQMDYFGQTVNIAARILGAVGLIVPAITGVLPWLTPLSAVRIPVKPISQSGVFDHPHSEAAERPTRGLGSAPDGHLLSSLCG